MNRRAEFREIARRIISADRTARKLGRSQDTIGVIARALDRAYRDGLAESGSNSNAPPSTTRPVFMDWLDVPPTSRDVLWSLTFDLNGSWNDIHPRQLVSRPPLPDRTHPQWLLVNGDREAGLYSSKAVAPLIRLGLLQRKTETGDVLMLSVLGFETCREYWRRVANGDPTLPIMSVRA